MPGSELGRRLVVAAVGIPFGIGVIYLGTWPVAVLLSAIGGLCALEVYRMAEESGVRPFRAMGLVATVLLVLAAAWTDEFGTWTVWASSVLMIVSLGALSGAVSWRGPGGHPLSSSAVTVIGVTYAGATLSFGVHLRSFPGVSSGELGWEGGLILIFPMTVAWVADAAAYFSGSWWGRAKLIPSISPGKTVVGAIGGLVGATLTAVLFTVILLDPISGLGLGVSVAAFVGISLGIVEQIGDLVASLLKREAGVKDSGHVFPGHGGMIDRFDSVLFALPAAYLLLLVFVDS